MAYDPLNPWAQYSDPRNYDEQGNFRIAPDEISATPDFSNRYQPLTKTPETLKALSTKLGINANDWDQGLAAYQKANGGTDADPQWWGDEATTRAYLQGMGMVDPTKYGSLWNDYQGSAGFNPNTEQGQQKQMATAGNLSQASQGKEGWQSMIAPLSVMLAPLAAYAGTTALGAGAGEMAGGMAGAMGDSAMMGSALLPQYGAASAAATAGLGTGIGDAATAWGIGNPGTSGILGSGTTTFDSTLGSGLGQLGSGTTNFGTGLAGTTGAGSAGSLGTGLAGAELAGTGLGGLTAAGAPLGTAGAATLAAGTGAATGSPNWLDTLQNLFKNPTPGASNLLGGNGTNSILGSLATYLSGNKTADAYSDLQKALLQAGDVSQRPGAQWALGQAQHYTGAAGQADYVNGLANPILASYQQHLPASVAKSGDLTNSLNKSVTDASAAISGNYNGFLNSLLGATGTTQPNNAVASAGQAGATGINQQQTGNNALYSGLGNLVSGGLNNLFNTPTASGTQYVGQ